MEKYISKENKSNLLKLGFYQTGGGIIGCLLMFWLVFKTDPINFVTIAIILFMTALFLFSFICGYQCLHFKEGCLKISLINQIIQSLGFAIFGFAYEFVAGFFVSIGIDLSTAYDFNFRFGISKVFINFNTNHELIEFNFNIVAIFICFWIIRLNKKIQNEITLQVELESFIDQKDKLSV